MKQILFFIMLVLLPTLAVSSPEEVCKPIVYEGPFEEKINLIFIPSEQISNEQELRQSVDEYFDKGKNVSFYSIYPYSEYENAFNFYYLNMYDIPPGPIKTVLKEKCPELSKYLHQIIVVGSTDKFTDVPAVINDYLTETSQIGTQYIFPYKSLHTFLHEIGHSFGGLNEGYGYGFLIGTPIAYYKENYDKKAPAYNWDIEGCPKWCSGEVNVNSVCYPAYSALKGCLLSPQTDTNEKAEACAASFFDTVHNEFGLDQPVDCNFGKDCDGDTNCWFIGNGYFRAHARDIMYSDEEGILETYGPAGEHIREVVELLLKSIAQNGQTVGLNVYNHSFYNEGYFIKGAIKFTLKNDRGEPFILLGDKVLNDAFFISAVNQVAFSPIKREDLKGAYSVGVSIYNPSKSSLKGVYLTFVSKSGVNKEWKYYLNLSSLSLAYLPQNQGTQDSEGPAKPYCGAIGSKSEGWYANGRLIRWDSCSNCEVKCDAIGSKREGWYSSCGGKSKLVKYGKCQGTAEPVADEKGKAKKEKILACNGSCPLDGRCYPFGQRAKNKFCSDAGYFVVQKKGYAACKNSFECSSNYCVGGACKSPSLMKKISGWFTFANRLG